MIRKSKAKRGKNKGSANGNNLKPYYQKTELKFTDTTVTQFASNVGQLSGLDYPTLGTGAENRLGNEITVRHIETRYHASLNGATANILRLLLLVDLQGYNSPAVTDIIQAANVGTAFMPISPFNYPYRKRFKILWEGTFMLCTAIPETTQRLKIPINLTTTFVGASTFVNQLYWLVCSDESNATNYPVVNACHRVVYSDQ